jgi:L-arabinose transport system substrate-binding protein
MIHPFRSPACGALVFLLLVAPALAQNRIKIGFVVKQAEEPWFQDEWKFAQQAADRDGFDLVKISAPDAARALTAIDNLSTQGAQGLVICTPDVHLGPAIVAKASVDGLKLISVDDQFIGPDGKFMANVHHLGISARNIGRKVGKALYDEMIHRGWRVEETAVCAVVHEELDTARQRTDGAIEALKESGFPAERIFKAQQKTTDVPGALDAANIMLIQHPDAKHWLICGMNDSAVLGAVRAMEGRGFGAADVVGVGIDGTDCINEFKKAQPTGFFASILLSPRRHGYDTAEMLYKWIKDGDEPPKVTYTDGVLITRDNYAQELTDAGLAG